jgi:hypothetical protein
VNTLSSYIHVWIVRPSSGVDLHLVVHLHWQSVEQNPTTTVGNPHVAITVMLVGTLVTQLSVVLGNHNWDADRQPALNLVPAVDRQSECVRSGCDQSGSAYVQRKPSDIIDIYSGPPIPASTTTLVTNGAISNVAVVRPCRTTSAEISHSDSSNQQRKAIRG